MSHSANPGSPEAHPQILLSAASEGVALMEYRVRASLWVWSKAVLIALSGSGTCFWERGP